MPISAQLSPELTEGFSALAGARLTASRACTLDPAEHPLAPQAVDRPFAEVRKIARGVMLSIAVTQTTLPVEGVLAGDEMTVAETAGLRHDRDILTYACAGEHPRVSPEAIDPEPAGIETLQYL